MVLYWCYILAAILGFVLVLYALIEIHYFLRMCLCWMLSKCSKNVHILDKTTITGVCLTNDLDMFFTHMNNARYFREMDFARADFYLRSGLYNIIVSNGGTVVQNSATIRYRRYIRPCSLFQITSQIVSWDDQYIYMEHRFISPKDNFVQTIAICRQKVIDCSVEEIMTILLNKSVQNKKIKSSKPSDISKIENGHVKTNKPDLPLEITKLIEYNEISSSKLRNES